MAPNKTHGTGPWNRAISFGGWGLGKKKPFPTSSPIITRMKVIPLLGAETKNLSETKHLFSAI